MRLVGRRIGHADGHSQQVLDLMQSPPAILRPGGVTREQLEAAIGPVTLAPSVADEMARQGLAGPGITGSITRREAVWNCLKATGQTATDRLLTRAIELRQRGHCVAALVSDEMLPVVEKVVELVASFGAWGDWEKLAKRLFAAFRVFDEQGAVVILCVLPPAEGIGLAVRERLQRAAGNLLDAPGGVRCAAFVAERWQSGLMRTLGKRVESQAPASSNLALSAILFSQIRYRCSANTCKNGQ